MISLTFIDQQGVEHTVRTEPGPTLMEVATFNNVPGILAECGGGASCGTCHVYVDEPWLSLLPEPEPEETDLVEFLEDVRRKFASRLSDSARSGSGRLGGDSCGPSVGASSGTDTDLIAFYPYRCQHVPASLASRISPARAMKLGSVAAATKRVGSGSRRCWSRFTKTAKIDASL